MPVSFLDDSFLPDATRTRRSADENRMSRGAPLYRTSRAAQQADSEFGRRELASATWTDLGDLLERYGFVLIAGAIARWRSRSK